MGAAPEEEVWDSGLQSERTRLAWVRTAVLLATGGLGAAGLALRHDLPVPAGVVFAMASFCGGLLLIRTRARYRRVQAALHGGRPLDHGADVLVAWLGTLCVVTGAIVFVWSQAL
ncbi:hypothetical protein Nocox_29385 [Nonomuraea coxensis DSM 45129]|uniref:DUF202 domain-containing protein n=1 Tax=Nonomuraea coxensis DSM 45129 TaxID=1122611 RepID=A0ABX8U6T9_9ACTN|nr:DUF202 domain-containing protein [Nonomuraea coxensis]QYC43461.1 hypothetical protein Nocox_29385 [Nonomuraea coxensis DSM 45129]